MNDAGNARQQIVDKIKESSNILVTVGLNPSVDELSAALGLTMMLNKLKKHATAVVSGDIPPAITFLDPAKTFENTVDSLRDFIIALDKEKADHLRYKVDGDVVKIFITPYRTTLSDADLDFSQGDYNVELVLALGVKDSEHLDKALEAHGKILHDATVVTVSAGAEGSQLGSIDWKDENASSLSEMLVSLSEAIKTDKALLDEQISTALLTGIVAATDRFSNDRTSSKVMTMAAQLMAAGANQQLIASKLEDAHEIGPEAETTSDDGNSDGTTDLSEGESTKLDKKSSKKTDSVSAEADSKPAVGTLAISHEPAGTIDEVAEQVSNAQSVDATVVAEQKLQDEFKTTTLPPMDEPMLGGTLNATAEEAASDTRQQLEDDRNRTLLNHGSGRASLPVADAPSFQSPFNAASQTDTSEPPTVDPFADSAPSSRLDDTVLPETQAADVSVVQTNPTLADLDAQNRAPHEDARAAVDAAFGSSLAEESLVQSETPSGLPPLPDFSTLPPLPPPPNFSQPTDTQPLGAVPPEQLADIFKDAPTTPAVPPANDPGQFKIPGQ